MWLTPHALGLELIKSLSAAINSCSGRVARSRRHGARALNLGRSLRTPSQELIASPGTSHVPREAWGASAPLAGIRLAFKESSSEERVPAEPGPKQGEASLRRGSPAPRKMDS